MVKVRFYFPASDKKNSLMKIYSNVQSYVLSVKLIITVTNMVIGNQSCDVYIKETEFLNQNRPYATMLPLNRPVSVMC